MPRKGENIHKRRDGRWEGRYKKGRKKDGSIIYGYFYAHSYQEVKDKLIELKFVYSQYYEPKKESVDYNGTMQDFSIEFMGDLELSDMKQSTFANYNSMMKKHIRPYFDDQKLTSLNTADMIEFVDYLKQKNMAAGAIHGVLGLLSRMLNVAVKEKKLLINPCEEIDLPKLEKAKIEPLSSTEQKELEAVAFQHEYGIPVILALYTGMRIGEISGLRWSDINFETGFIHVQRTIQRISVENSKTKTTVIIDTPKTDILID